MEPTRKRLNINISPSFEDAIVEIMQKHGVSKTRAVARLAGIGKYILDAQNRGDKVTVGGQNIHFNF